VGRPGDGKHELWTIIIGTGYVKDESKQQPAQGSAFVYTSKSPTSGGVRSGGLSWVGAAAPCERTVAAEATSKSRSTALVIEV